jgi:IS5 family transposase
MPPKKLKLRDDELFRMQLAGMIDMEHPLVKLAGMIDWSRFDEAYGGFYTQKGRPGLPTRLMAGLHLLKHMEGLSDESVCRRWVENPYFQYFCGEQFFRHKLVLDRSSMTRWRDRIGADKLELLLAETLAVAIRTQAVSERAMERVTVDTTVQTKAVAHPTDSHLLMRGIERLNALAKKHNIKLRQSFLRVGRQAKRDVSRLIHGRGHKQAMRWVRKLRTWLGRLDRDIGRKIAGDEMLEAAFADTRERVARILVQRAGDTGKLYAFHAPEVECIAKGKARSRYEFGVKTSIAVTNARTAGGQFIVGMQALPGSPYDGHTLSGQIEQVERLTGVAVERAYVDRGYRGHKHSGKAQVYIACRWRSKLPQL